MFSYTLIIISFALIHHVLSYGSGAPSSRCEVMLPGHWVSPQETPCPFQISIDKTEIVPGDRVNITISAIPGHTGFKGFFIMVKEVGNRSDRNYGSFDLTTSNVKQAQPVHCFNVPNSAMTHVTNEIKSSIQLYWIAPKLGTAEEMKQQGSSSPYREKQLKVVATFVKDFYTIWTDVEPISGAKLLLQDRDMDAHQLQLSPKFQMSTDGGGSPNLHGNNGGHAFRDDIQATIPSSNNANGNNGVAELDGNSSWDHVKRMWNFMLNFFSRSQQPSTSSTVVVTD